VKEIAYSLRIPLFVVGAAVRDFMLEHCYGIRPRRMTRDIDLGVEVAGWDQLNQLKVSLVAGGQFSQDEREPQRLHCGSLIVDIVPFGPMADKDIRISWPPEHEAFMSLLGFEEAFEYSITVRLGSDPYLDIRVPTLPGLALMKLISWEEKYPERGKDAEDLLFIMQEYEDAGCLDRLFGEEQDILSEEDFDVRSAAIRLLGRDMARTAYRDTLKAVKAILDAETGEQLQYRLVADMMKGSGLMGENPRQILLQVERLRKGFVEIEDGRRK